jgi:hypothetical protein
MKIQEMVSNSCKILRENSIIFLPAFIIALLSAGGVPSLNDVLYWLFLWAVTTRAHQPTPGFFSLTEAVIWLSIRAVTTLVKLFLLCTIIRMIYDATRKSLSLKRAIKFVASKYLTILAANILFSIIIGVGFLISIYLTILPANIPPLIIRLGFLALIISEIYLTVRLLFYNYAILVDEENAFNSLRKTWKITKGRWWKLFGLLIMVQIPIVVISFLVRHFSRTFFEYSPFMLSVSSFFVNLFYLPLVYSIFTLAYLELRVFETSDTSRMRIPSNQ